MPEGSSAVAQALRRVARRRRRPPVVVPHPEIQRSQPAPRRPAKPTGVFAQPIGPATAPIERAQKKAARGVARAERQLPAETRLPRFPLLKRYTAPQRHEIIARTTQGLQRIAAEDGVPHSQVAAHVFERAKSAGDKGTLQTLRQFKSAYAKEQAAGVRTQTGKHGSAFRLLPLARYLSTRSQLETNHAPDVNLMGFDVTKLGAAVDRSLFPAENPGLRLLKAPFALGAAAIEDPGGVAKASIRTGVESIAGIPQSVKMLVEHPHDALKAIAADYERRYGSLLEGDTHTFKERIKHDYGITPYALDAAAAAGGVGVGAGKIAEAGSVGRLAARLADSREPLSRAVGKTVLGAHHAMTEERPKLRVSGGPTGALEQPTSKNLFVAYGQRALDRARLAKSERARAAAGEQRAQLAAEGHGTRVVAPREGRVSGLEAERKPGEVLPHFSLRESALLRRYTGRTERLHGSRKSQERLRLLHVGGQVEKEARGLVNSLDKNERDALLYSMEFGARSHSLEGAVAALRRYRRQVTEHRVSEGAVGALEPDELPVIDRILADPAKHFTPKLDQVAERLRQLELDQAARDPGLVAEQAATRRLLPQSMLLGHEARRAPDVADFHARLTELERKLRRQGVDPGNLIDQFGGLAHVEPQERLAVVRDLERHYRIEARKAGRAVETARRRESKVQGALEERKARGRPIRTEAVRQAERDMNRAQSEVDRLEKAAQRIKARKPPRAKGGAAAAQLRELRVNRDERQVLADHHRQALEQAKAAGDRQAVREHQDAIDHYQRQADKYAGQLQRAEAGQPIPFADAARGERDVTPALQAARTRLEESRKALGDELASAPRVGDKLIAKRERVRQEVIKARAVREDARIRHAVSAYLRGEIKRDPGRYESLAKFEQRVTKAAEAAGLDAPGYFESAGGSELRRSLHALGTGIRAAAPPKAYSGARFLAGRQAGDPEIVIAGLLRNAKRRFSWRFTLTSANQAAFDWSRGAHGAGLTAAELRREFDKRGIDPTSVEIVNTRVLEQRELAADAGHDGTVSAPGIDGRDLADVQRGLHDATIGHQQLLREAEDVTAGRVRGQAMNRYIAMPARDFAELSAAMRPDGAAGRALDILWKQKPARIMLGLANTSWLGFQVMANGFVAGLGGTLNPFDYLAAQRWWRTLTPDEKLAIEPELGITHSHHHAGDQTQLGAAVNSRLVNGYHAFRKATLDRKVKLPGSSKSVSAHDLNPLDAMFRADEAQNNFFRRAVFYNKAKRDAYKRMGASWTSIDGAQKKIASILSLKRPEDRLKAIVNDHALFERHAAHVRDFLGDYLTYTSRERQTIARSAMFYGYLRFSLRFLFWTMPVKHPITAAVIGDLGRLGSQEVKRLLGVPPDAPGDNYRSEAVPVQLLAQMYFGSAADIRAEKPGAGVVNFGRMNPFLNAATQIERPEQIFGLLSPVFLAEIDQIETRSSFRGRTWRIGGQPTPGESERPQNYFGSILGQLHFSIPGLTKGTPRGRILERQLLEMASPFRMYERGAMPGSQSDDSLPWFQLPMQYKDPGARKGVAKAAELDKQTGPAALALRQAIPWLGPQPTAAPIALDREREKRQAVAGTKKKKRRKKTGALSEGGGGSGFSG